jgi:hypothetical protein
MPQKPCVPTQNSLQEAVGHSRAMRYVFKVPSFQFEYIQVQRMSQEVIIDDVFAGQVGRDG